MPTLTATAANSPSTADPRARARLAPNAALEACLARADDLARLTARLDEALGNWHGLSFADFRLLRRLAMVGDSQPQALSTLSAGLGLSPSALLRQILPLEKTGLVSRGALSTPGARSARGVALRPAGRGVLMAATDTAAHICLKAEPTGATGPGQM